MVFFRVDSNSIIAGGHIMRCIALANSFKEIGEDCLFLIADSNPVPVLNQYQLSHKVLNTDWKDLMSDKEIVIDYLKREKNPILIIDTYSVTKSYVDAVKPFGKIVYLGSKPEYLGDLDMLINYSTDIDYKFYYQYPKKSKMLLGPAFAPLREEFQNKKHVYTSKVRKVLLTTGNTDPSNIVSELLKGIKSSNQLFDVSFEVIIGRMFQNKEEIYRICENQATITIHENVKKMSELIGKCDLAISANGTTIYELSAMGVPVISFAMVEEQIKSAEALSKLGVIDYCGCSVTDYSGCVNRIIDRLIYYIHNNDELTELAKKAHTLIDGNGCIKIRDEMFKL